MSKAIDQLKQELKDDRQKLKDEAERIEEKAKLVGRLEKLESEKGVGFDEDEDEEVKTIVTPSKKDQPKREYRRVQKKEGLTDVVRQFYCKLKKKGKYVPIHYTEVVKALKLEDKKIARKLGIKKGEDKKKEVLAQVQYLCKTGELRLASKGTHVYVPEEEREERKKLKEQLIPDFSKVGKSKYKKIVQVLFKQGQESIKKGSEFTLDDLWDECVRQDAGFKKKKDLISSFNKIVANYSWLVSRLNNKTSGKFKLHCKSVPKKIQRASDEAQAKLDEMDRTLVG